MSKPSARIDFNEVAKVINSNFAIHKSKMKECCVRSSVIPLHDYYEALQKEFQEIESTITPQKTKPTIGEYIDLFKAFDDYPSNLQKPKKLIKVSSTKSAKQNSSTSTSNSINSTKTLEDQPSAATIYNEFSLYTQKLSEFKEELRMQSLSKEYTEKLECINTFARELDKLLLSEDTSVKAFTEEEEVKLKMILEHMEHFVYIQENKDLYGTVQEGCDHSARLNDLIDIVTCALVAVNCFKAS